MNDVSCRVVKISRQMAHFIGCSEKCAGYSKCLELNFQHGSRETEGIKTVV